MATAVRVVIDRPLTYVRFCAFAGMDVDVDVGGRKLQALFRGGGLIPSTRSLW